jgi:2-polyprenyl-3-methyl-5-hydroxy-6-metoxy-1,4-benzoquinol methylase
MDIINKATKYYINLYFYSYYFSLKEKIKRILDFNENSTEFQLKDNDERGLPGASIYRHNGYYKYMLGRYLLSIRYIKNKKVLDTGSGLGWGAYLISDYADSIDALDRDRDSIKFSKKIWPTKNVIYTVFDTQHLYTIKKKYDVTLCYEFIEHLSISIGLIFLNSVFNLLNKSGVLIMSSHFPRKKSIAFKEESKNPYHLHIYTKKEIFTILHNIGFKKIKFIGNSIVVAKKNLHN